MGQPIRYRLLAYVCGQACVRYVEGEATRTFARIFIDRPDDCRYAVVSYWNTRTHGSDVLVFDLFEAKFTGTGTVDTPEPIRTAADMDAAIMATAMLYEDR